MGKIEQKHEPRHYDSNEIKIVSNLKPLEAKEWLEKEGIKLNSGDVEVFVDGKRFLMATSKMILEP